jgi:pimeloyl-ACP methyl ester carboxylesterase
MLDELHSVPVDGAVLRTRRVGVPSGRALLFLHGGLGSMEDFDLLVSQMTDFQSVLVDSRGHGASTLGPPLSYERLALDVEAVMDFYGLTEPIIVGHSDGGIAAIRVAAAKRKKIRGLVLLCAHADPPAASMLEEIFAKLTAEGWRAKFPENVALYERLNPEPDFDRLFSETLAMWCDTSPGNYPGDLARLIECPVLVLGGSLDHLVPASVTLDLAHRIPGAHLGILPFGSHVVFQEQPGMVLSYLRQFIGRL